MARSPALSATDALGFDVAVEVEGGFVVVFVVRGGGAVGAALVVLADVIVLGVGEVLRHHERLVVELERVVVVGRGVVLRGGAADARALVRVGVGVERVGRVRRQRGGRHRAAVPLLARRRSNAGGAIHKRMSVSQ